MRYAEHHGDKLEMAKQALAVASGKYPNSSTIRADYAIALAQLEDQNADDEAVRALELDDLNIRYGHRDKYLDSSQRERLQKIVSE